MNINKMFEQYSFGIYILIAIVIMLIIILTIKSISRRRARVRRQQLDPYRITMQDIDQMEGSEFERYLYRFFTELGYEDTYKTQGSGDFGADLVFTDREGIRNVLQAKCYAEHNKIGLSAVQEIYSSMRYYEADKCIVLTSSYFTKACETLAGVNAVKLLDRNDLIQLIEDFKSNDHEEVMDIIESEPVILLSPWQKSTNQRQSQRTRKSR
ncbi:restriction endonuclease [Paenibacillus kyungheensis]